LEKTSIQSIGGGDKEHMNGVSYLQMGWLTDSLVLRGIGGNRARPGTIVPCDPLTAHILAYFQERELRLSLSPVHGEDPAVK
jgi:hypothetical protein